MTQEKNLTVGRASAPTTAASRVRPRASVPLAKGFEVEWCAGVPKDEDGENDLDSADYRIRDFATIEAARVHAKKVFPKDWFGSVRITPFEMVPYEEGRPAKFKEYSGESEHYEGES